MFAGSFVALTTPFKSDLSLDLEALDRLVERQIEAGITGLVPCGTTGESPTLSGEEQRAVISRVIAVAAGRVPVIAGTGSYDTRASIELTAWAKEAGADGGLVITPYYNKPDQKGLIRHFEALAEVGLPLMLYNVPGRTGVAIAIETAVKLSAHPHIVSIKEAAGCVDRVSELCNRTDLDVFSGDDSLTLPMMSVGAKGVVSVAANLVPDRVAALCQTALDGDFVAARALHARLFPVFRAMFIETNPQPVKTAQARLGLLEEVFRLPLCAMEDATRAELEEVMCRAGILERS